MIPSIFHYIKELQDEPDEIFFSSISEATNGIFNGIVDLYPDKYYYARCIIRYIAYAYSKDSNVLVHGSASLPQKLRIANAVGIPEIEQNKVVKLQHEVIRDAVLQYLELQTDRDFRHYKLKMDLYDQMMELQASIPRKDDGSTDFKSILDASRYMDSLKEDIERYETNYHADYKFKEDNEEEIRQIEKEAQKPQLTLRPEDNPVLSKNTNSFK